nr:isocitrate dehydrogenase [NAD] subunit gamma, mitochondrial isoform X3 [Taeniopygia guttata]
MAAALTAVQRRVMRAALRPRAVWLPQAGISHAAEKLHLPPQRSIPPPRQVRRAAHGDADPRGRHRARADAARQGGVPPRLCPRGFRGGSGEFGGARGGRAERDHGHPAQRRRAQGHKSRNNLIRTSLDLYANVIHCRSLPGVETRHRDIDILIVRENTEGEYSSLEHESVAGVVESLKIITAGRSRRIAHYAFGLARAAARRSVTAVHKANIMKLGDGLFLQCCREVAAEYPEITFRSMIVDNTTMQLVSRPQQFDVMVMPNLYGNIVNNVCAGLVGGPGLVPGANYGHDYAVFETATRNTGKSIANRNIANPTAALLAACMMLDHLRLHGHASTIRQAVLASLDDPRTHTPDIGGQGTTSGAVQSIIGHLPRG